MSGLTSYHAGLAAESSVERLYSHAGRTIAAGRWRGQSGEIDLIARDGAEVIFIEVKKSATHALAAEHLQGNRVWVWVVALKFFDMGFRYRTRRGAPFVSSMFSCFTHGFPNAIALRTPDPAPNGAHLSDGR